MEALEHVGHAESDLGVLFRAASSGNIMGLHTVNFNMSVDLNQQGTCGRTALSVSAGSGHAFFVQLLRTKGARIYMEGCSLDRSALHWAAASGQLSCIQSMLETVPDPELGISENLSAELNRRDSQGSTPLFLASTAHPRSCEAFLYLLRNDAVQAPEKSKVDSEALHNPNINDDNEGLSASPPFQDPVPPATRSRSSGTNGSKSTHTIKSPGAVRIACNAHKNGYHSAAESTRESPEYTATTSMHAAPALSGYSSAGGEASTLCPERPPLKTSRRHEEQQAQSPCSCCSISPCSASPSSVLPFQGRHHPRSYSRACAKCPQSMPFLSPPPTPCPIPNLPPRHDRVPSPPPVQRRQKGLASGLPPRHFMPPQDPPVPQPLVCGKRTAQPQNTECDDRQPVPPLFSLYQAWEGGGIAARHQPCAALVSKVYRKRGVVPCPGPLASDNGCPDGREEAWGSNKEKTRPLAAGDLVPDLWSSDELTCCPSPPQFREPPVKDSCKPRQPPMQRRSLLPRHSFAVTCHARMESSGAEILRELTKDGEELPCKREASCGLDLAGVRALKEKKRSMTGVGQVVELCKGERGSAGSRRDVAVPRNGANSGVGQGGRVAEELDEDTASLPVVRPTEELTKESQSGRRGRQHLYAHWLRMDFLSMVVEAGDLFQLRKEIQKQELNEPNKRGLTLVMVAAKQGHKRCVIALLVAGASVFVKNSALNRSALHWAAERGHADVLMAILEVIKKPTFLLEMQRKDSEGNTPLTLSCCMEGNRGAFLFLYRLQSAQVRGAPPARRRVRRTAHLSSLMSQ